MILNTISSKNIGLIWTFIYWSVFVGGDWQKAMIVFQWLLGDPDHERIYETLGGDEIYNLMAMTTKIHL